MGSGCTSACSSRFSLDSAGMTNMSSVSVSEKDGWQAAHGQDLETEARIHNCDFHLQAAQY